MKHNTWTTRVLRDGEVVKFSIVYEDDWSEHERYIAWLEPQSRGSEYTVQTSASDGSILSESTLLPNR